MHRIAGDCGGGSGRFQTVVAAFLAQSGLPFAGVLSAERVERVFARHGNLFGMNTIYSTVLTLWAFLGQTLRDGKEASCQSAVACIVTHQQQAGLAVPTSDTGDCCRARGKLSEAALHDLAVEVAEELEEQAEPAWLWKERHAKLVDGFTFTMPDTPANQAEYPQPRSQKQGVGFPIARACAILSLATACVTDLAIGPYAGKETGETALLRELLDSLNAGDVAVADRFYCSFLMIALLLLGNVDVCARMHQRRHVDFRRGRRLGKYDHLVEWTKPARPDWMDEETYAALHDIQPRQISFTGTCQYVLSSWMLLSLGLLAPRDILTHCPTLLLQISQCEVANRPGRLEPRVLKRRRHRYPLMREPRAVLKAKLQNDN